MSETTYWKVISIFLGITLLGLVLLLIAEKMSNHLAAVEIKKTKAQQEQDLEDKGHARAILGEPRVRAADIADKQIKAKKELIEKIIDTELNQEVAIIAAEHATTLIEQAVFSVDDIIDNHADWIDAYEDQTGKKAIWHGRITEGFKDYIQLNGLK